jgi:long-chain acyl-CoA synthetase
MANDPNQVGFFAGEALERSAKRHPDKVALIARDREMKFAEVEQAATRLAAHMQCEGVKQGDRVGLLLPNSLAFALSYYATQKMGAVTTVMDARLKGKELEGVLRDGDLGLLISYRGLISENAETLSGFERLPRWIVDGEGDECFEKRLSSDASDKFVAPTQAPEQDAVILYTSGTTGEPKGVVSTMVIFDQINPISLLEGIQRFGVTIYHGVPPIFQLLLGARNLKDYDTRSVKFVGMMGTTVPLSLMRAFKAAQPHIKVIQGYGLTETSPIITFVELERADAKLGSIGRSVPGVEVMLVNEKGEETAEGEIITRGPHVMKGYFRRPEATAERIHNGWLYTGDIGRRDEDGYYYHLGRKDDLIITGGMNVYPAEVENLLCEHPQVHEAAVFPIPDPGRGKVLGAAVVPRPGEKIMEKEILGFLRSNLAIFKVPQKITIRDSLPRTATGKVKREDLG